MADSLRIGTAKFARLVSISLNFLLNPVLEKLGSKCGTDNCEATSLKP